LKATDGPSPNSPAAVRKARGRPEVEIPLDQVEKLGALQCTEAEMAGFFGVSLATIKRRMAEEEFRAVYQRGAEKGRISLRRSQFKLAESGNPALNIWLGKQYLGQKEKLENTLRTDEPLSITVAFVKPQETSG
jgi:hypothetical protein